MDRTFENWLVVSDIDGTLKNKIRRIPSINVETIKKFTELGGNFTLASGRTQSSLGRNYNRITPNQPAVVLNGAGLYDFNQGKMIWRSTIGKKGRDFVKYISTEFDDIFKSVDIGIYFDDYVYIVHSGLLSKTTMRFDKAHFEYVKSVDRVPEEGWMKVIFWALPATMMKLQSRILTMENPDANFMPSSAVTLEMLQKDTHKGVGIMKLADMLGIEKSHVAA
ncbi:MAG: HAD hydrolase family protein, partial [Eubacterium sp.]|nr:HAD hydrolase family protein [Eubacterium sp.]